MLFNWLWLVQAQVVVRIVALGYKVFLARTLGPAGYGQYAWVVTTVLVFTIVVEAGLNRLLIRDVARAPERGRALLGRILQLRLGLAGAAFVLMLATFSLVPTDAPHFRGLIVVGLTLAIAAGALTFDAAFYATEHARYSGNGQVLVTVVSAALGVAAVLLGFGLPGLYVTVVLSQLVQALYLWQRLARLDLRPAWTGGEALGRLLRDAAPYAILGVLGVIYFRIDTVMLQPMRGDAETGVYTAAFKLLEVLLFVPGTLAAVIMPRMARYHTDDHARLRESHLRLTRLLAAAAVPITVALWVLSPWIVRVFYGEAFAPAALVLRWLALAFLFHCLHTPNATLVLSGTVLAPVVWISIGTTACNVVLNALFIPRYGATAAAAATLASEVVSWGAFTLYIHRRLVRLDGWGAAVGPTAAAAGGGLLVLVLAAQLGAPPAALLVAGGVAYAAAAAALGVVRREDLALIRHAPPAEPAAPEELDLA